jgi:hypothetical protein
MNSRRDFSQDRFGRGRDDSRSFSRDPRGEGQAGGWHGSGSDWDVDSREGAPYGSGQERFGEYGGSMNYGNPYRSRQQGDASRQSPWDEDRFGYPESGGASRDLGRGGPQPGYGPQGRFGEDRYSWGQQYGQHEGRGRGSPQQGGFDAPRQSQRHYEPRQSSGWDSSWGQGGSGGGRDTFAGAGGSYGGDPAGMFGGWGIPSGSELGGYGMNAPNRGGPQNWSGSNWGNQGGTHWGESHSGRFAGSESFGGGMRGRTPKGYTRSDDRIKDDVCEQLYRTPDIDVSEVTVEARNGTVTLEGTVPDRRMKHRIEDLCEQCIGVQDVENRIRVQRQDGGSGSRFASSSSSSDEDRTMSSSGSGTGSATERSNKKSSTGPSSSSH